MDGAKSLRLQNEEIEPDNSLASLTSVIESVDRLASEVEGFISRFSKRLTGTIDETASDLQVAIAESREDIGTCLRVGAEALASQHELIDEMRSKPLTMLGVSVVLGFVLGEVLVAAGKSQ